MNLLTAMVLCAMGAGTAGGSQTGAGESSIRLERGRTEVVIVEDAPAIVRYAADEATNLLANVLGAPVPLVNRVGDGSTPVYIGAGPWTKDAGLDVSGFARDEYAMRTFGRGVILVGRDGTDPDPFPKPTRQFREFCWQSQVERASLFALYDFLERYAGARFYFPGELGTILPRTDRIVVTDAEFRSKPDFQVRRFGYRDGTIPKAILDEFGGDPVAVRRVEFNRLRMETKYFPCCHGLNKFEYLKRFGKTHPEYFALNAQGVRNTSGAGHIGQVCYSSPIAEVIYEDVKAYLTGQPSASRGIEPRWGSNCIGDVVDVMSQDGMFPCSCAACQSRYDFAHGPNYATEFIWSNTVAIANRLTREGVKGTITQMAYRPYRSVPKTVEIPDNVAVMVAETGPWTLADEKVFAAQTDEIRAWAEKLGRKVWTWNYTCKATSTGLNIPGIPSTTPRAVGEYYKRIAPYVFGAFTETSSVDRWLYNHLNYYVFSRVMWDKSSDVDAILEEYYRLMYGPAAPEMKEFFESLEEKWAKHVAGVFRDSSVGPKAAPPTDAEMYGEVYSPAVRARYRELFRAAEAKAAGDSLVLRRLKLMREEFLDPIDANAAEYEARKVRLAAFVVPGGKDMEPQALSYLDIGGKAKTPKIKDLRTTFRAWFEKGMLRIVVECAEPYMDKRMNAPFKDEISVTADDCLELYVNPSGDRRRCFNFVVSSEGLLADAKFTKVGSAIGAIAKDYGWNSGFTAKVTRRSDGWTADVTIPQKALKGISASEGRIPLNVCRSRQVDDGLRGGNYYVWGDFVKGFPDVQNFGTILFYEGRIRAIDPVKAGELRLRPTFVSCGVSYGIGSDKPVDFAYRRRGDATWRKGLQPPYFAETRDVRGSLLGLDEDADYEVRVLVEGRVAAEGTFRTWSSDVPIAKTVEIDPAQVDFPITVTDRGTPDGWIRYRVKPGCALDNRTDRACFVVEDASYVTIDDSVIRGCASRHAIEIVRSDHVRVRNCDISGWGRVGRQKFAREGRFYPVKKSQDPRWNGIINYDGAIEIGEANRAVVVERCWIHDPNGQANSWRYSHPAGPEAITVKSPDHSTVIRWCDFTGSDEHRWNDAVESLGNFDERGGFNRDADVYGNFMIYANDDCIELDGGQQNVRCFGNRFESALCGVSIQGCMVSPSYVYDNLFSGMGDRFGECGQTIKTSSVDPEMRGSWCLIHDNVLWGGGSGLRLESVWKRTRYDVRRNRFCGGQRLEGRPPADRPGNLRAEGNVLEDALAERDLDPAYPRRPLAFVLDRVRLTDAFEGAPTSFVVRAVSSAREPIPFSIAKNGAFGWFDVSPSGGRIPAQGQVALTVTPNAARMGERRFWRGAFLVRTPEGLSRPFSFELENRAFVEPFRCEKPGELAVYADTEPFELGAEREFAFTWPKDARGFFLLRLAGAMNAPYEVSVDGAPWSVSSVQGFPGLANWSIVSTRGELWQGRISFFDLKAGRHTLKVRALGEPKKGFPSGPIRIEGAVLTDSPGSFEPR